MKPVFKNLISEIVESYKTEIGNFFTDQNLKYLSNLRNLMSINIQIQKILMLLF